MITQTTNHVGAHVQVAKGRKMPPRLLTVVPLIALSTTQAIAQKPIEVYHPSGKWQPRTAADYLTELRSNPPAQYQAVSTTTCARGTMTGYNTPRWYRDEPRFRTGPCYTQPAPYPRYDPWYYDTYELDRLRAQREQFRQLADQRAGHLMNQWSELFDEGLAKFHEGDYERALVSFLGAADANQGSAAPRLHAAHAAFALGRYTDALDLVARAFELSPMLIYKSYDIRDEYGDRTDFDKQLLVLRKFTQSCPRDPAASAFLGYATFFTRGPAAARSELEIASRLNTKSYFLPKLLAIARACGNPQPRPPFNTVAPKPDRPATRQPGLMVVQHDGQSAKP
jgi:tetratricopeptide (TPR) repeat protein